MSGFYAKPCRVRGGAGAKSGRWNPTGEQVKVLTDLFRSGLRSPGSDQIEKISDQLSFFGEIESKNVFYWFQNHKARERQKRLRVRVGDEVVVHGRDLVSSPKQINEGFEPTGVTETLQLFPVNTYEESEPEKTRLCAGEGKENHAYPYNSLYSFNTEMDHPPLDLRLSFL